MNKNKFGLEELYIDGLRQVFGNYSKVTVFGSRSRGDYRFNSDLDLCIFDTISFGEYLQLLVEIDDLEMPYKVDLLRFNSITNQNLLDKIESEGVSLF